MFVVKEKRTCSADNLFFGHAALAKKQAGGQSGKVHLSCGAFLRRNALARLIIYFLGHSTLAKNQADGWTGKVHLSRGVVIRRNALARLIICFLGKQRWLRSNSPG